MPTEATDADILLLNEAIEVEEADVDTEVSVTDPDQLQKFLDREEKQLKEKVQRIVDLGADVVFCQKGIDDLAQHYLAKEGILAVRRAKKSDLEFLQEVVGASLVSDLESATSEDLGFGDVTRDDEDELFYYVEGEDARRRPLLRGSTDHVVDELERGVNDALDVVAQTVSDGPRPRGRRCDRGRTRLASARLRRLRLRPRAAGRRGVRRLARARPARPRRERGSRLDRHAGRPARGPRRRPDYGRPERLLSGDVEDTFEAGVVEPAHAKEQAVTSAAEAANLVLKIDDIISAGDLSTDKGDDEAGGPVVPPAAWAAWAVAWAA